MKSLKMKLKNQRGISQSTPLINSPPSPDYRTTVAVTDGRRQQSVSSIPEDTNENTFDIEERQGHRQRFFSVPTSPSSPTAETNFGTMQKKEASWVTEARVQSSKDPVLNSKDRVFSFVKVSNEDPWLTGVWQTGIILFLFLILPSVIFSIAGIIFIRCFYIPNAGRSKREKKKIKVVVFGLIASIIVSTIKDSIITLVILRSLSDLQTSLYDIVYAGVILLLLLVFAVAPVTVYAFSGVSFSYGNEVASDGTPEGNNKGKKLAVEFMKSQLSSVHEVSGLKEQGSFLFKQSSRFLILPLIVTFFVVCVLRNFTPWILRATQPQTSYKNISAGNSTFRNTTNIYNGTSSYALHDVVLVLSGINAFVTSFALSFVFLIVVAWNLLMYTLWRSFLAPVNGKADLLYIGVDGIAAWWRIYQTLSFLTSSHKTPVGFLQLTLHCIFSGSIIVISVYLLIFSSFVGPLQTTAWFMVIDNLLLTIGLVMSLLASAFAVKVKASILKELSLNRLNMASKVGATNHEAEKVEGEYHAHLKRFKGRNLRTSLQLLQELYLVLKEVDSNSVYSAGTIIYSAVVVVGLVSVGKALRELL